MLTFTVLTSSAIPLVQQIQIPQADAYTSLNILNTFNSDHDENEVASKAAKG